MICDRFSDLKGEDHGRSKQEEGKGVWLAGLG